MTVMCTGDKSADVIGIFFGVFRDILLSRNQPRARILGWAPPDSFRRCRSKDGGEMCPSLSRDCNNATFERFVVYCS